MTDPEWSDFKVVLALGRSGSVAGAARILGVDASTVSRRLAAAETAMGAVLIVRGGREFEPPRDCRRLQFLRRRSHHEQYNTPKETPQLCT